MWCCVFYNSCSGSAKLGNGIRAASARGITATPKVSIRGTFQQGAVNTENTTMQNADIHTLHTLLYRVTRVACHSMSISVLVHRVQQLIFCAIVYYVDLIRLFVFFPLSNFSRHEPCDCQALPDSRRSRHCHQPDRQDRRQAQHRRDCSRDLLRHGS